MKNLLSNVVGKIKNYALIILCVVCGVSLVCNICNIISYGYSGELVGIYVISLFIECGLFAGMLVSYCLKQTKMCNILIKLYLAYFLLRALFLIPYLLCNWTGVILFPGMSFMSMSGALSIVRQVFLIFTFLAVVAVGVFYIMGKVKGTDKFEFYINILLFSIVCLAFLEFILAIVDTAGFYAPFAQIIAPFFTIAIVLLFCLGSVPEQNSDRQSDEVKVYNFEGENQEQLATQEHPFVVAGAEQPVQEVKQVQPVVEETPKDGAIRMSIKKKKSSSEKYGEASASAKKESAFERRLFGKSKQKTEEKVEEESIEKVEEKPVTIQEEKPVEKVEGKTTTLANEDVEIIEEIIYVDEDYEGDDVIEEVVYEDEVVEKKPATKKTATKKASTKSSGVKTSTAKKATSKKSSK